MIKIMMLRLYRPVLRRSLSYYIINPFMEGKKKGKLIVLEGLDRSGKSSVSKFIADHLQTLKLDTSSINFPDRTTPIGQMINNYLKSNCHHNDQTIHLLFSANRWECMPKIQQLLSDGNYVICDRYWYSGVAYSCAKGLDYEWCKAPDQGLIEPDLVIYLRADPEVLQKRKDYGEERY